MKKKKYSSRLSSIYTAVIAASLSIGVMVSPESARARLPKNKVVATITLGFEPQSIAISPDSSTVYVVNTGSNTVSVVSAGTNQVTANITVGNYPDFVAISPDGTTLYVSNRVDQTVSVIATASDLVTETLALAGQPWGLAVSPDGTQVYVATAGGTVSVIDTATNQLGTAIILVGSPIWVAFTPDGSAAYVLNDANYGFLSVINPSTGSVSATTVGAGEIYLPQFATVSPDGTKLYVADEVDYLAVINLAKNTLITTVPFIPVEASDVRLGQPVVTPNGLFVYVPNYTNGTVVMLGASDNKVRGQPIPVGINPYFAAIAPNGAFLYVTNTNSSAPNGTMSVIDISQ